MLRIFVFFALVLFSIPSQAEWQLAFSDEFNGDLIDKAKWKYADYWGNRTYSSNGEKQCYFSEMISQKDGVLSINAVRRKVMAKDCAPADKELAYASGMLTTAVCNEHEHSFDCARLKGFSLAYGFFEIKARLPKGKGLWPAFWLLPAGKRPPEIDIMEAVGHRTSQIHHTYHVGSPSGEKKITAIGNVGDFSVSFNTYGLQWAPGLLIWYINGVETFRYSGGDVSSEPMYLLLNLAVAGDWPGDPDGDTSFPAVLEVDYVRVYKNVGSHVEQRLPTAFQEYD